MKMKHAIVHVKSFVTKPLGGGGGRTRTAWIVVPSYTQIQDFVKRGVGPATGTRGVAVPWVGHTVGRAAEDFFLSPQIR